MPPHRKRRKLANKKTKGVEKSPATPLAKKWNGFHHLLLSTPLVILEKNEAIDTKAGNLEHTFVKTVASKPSKYYPGIMECFICAKKFSTPPTICAIEAKDFHDLIFIQDVIRTEIDHSKQPSFPICTGCSGIVKNVGRILKQIKEMEQELKSIVICVRTAIKLRNGQIGQRAVLKESNSNNTEIENEEYPDYFMHHTLSDTEPGDTEDDDIKPLIEDPLDLDVLMETNRPNHAQNNIQHLESDHNVKTKMISTSCCRIRPGPKSKTKLDLDATPLTFSVSPEPNKDMSMPSRMMRKSRLKAEELLKTSFKDLEADDEVGWTNRDIIPRVSGLQNENVDGSKTRSRDDIGKDDPIYSEDNDDENDSGEDDDNYSDGGVEANVGLSSKSSGAAITFPRRKPKSRSWDLPCTCPTCGKSFTSRKSFVPHMQRVHLGIRRFKCPLCIKVFYRNYDLVKHNRSVHNKTDGSTSRNTKHSIPFKCSICGRNYSTKGSLTEHTKHVHEGFRPFKCQIEGCSKSFCKRREYSNHLLSHSSKESSTESFQKHICEICGKALLHADSLKKHLRDVHDGIPSQPRKTYTCSFPGCTKVVFKITNFHRHLETHKPTEQRTRCPICQEDFPTIQAKDEHRRSVHEGKSNFKCDQCVKSFPRMASLKLHLKCHTAEQPFQCDKCGTKFKHKCTLLSHSRTVCGTDEEEMERMRTKLKESQRRHRRKVKKIECDMCDHKFVDVIRLQTHMLRAHGDKSKVTNNSQQSESSEEAI